MKPKVKILVVAIILVLTVTAVSAGIVLAKPALVLGRFVSRTMMSESESTSSMMGGNTPTEMMNGNSHSQMMGGTDTDHSSMDQMHDGMSAEGGMHTIIWQGLADALGMTSDELNAELTGDKTIIQIAEAKGVQPEQLAQKLETLVSNSLEQAITDGKISREQADQMLSHMDGNYLAMLDHMGNEDPSNMESCHQLNSTSENG